MKLSLKNRTEKNENCSRILVGMKGNLIP
uniref:Uncharacterized protein n=1 Tax=Anguilla anguilla TaxID=7936 RepID=A0A0E9TU28_ANGAN